MYHLQLVVGHLIVGHSPLGTHDHAVGDLASDRHHAQGEAVLVDVVRDDACAAAVEPFAHEAAHIVVEDAGADDAVGHECRRHHRHDDGDDDVTPHADILRMVEERLLLELHHPDTQVGGKADEDGVDEKQIEGAEEVVDVAGCQAESCRAEGRHERSGDGHSGQHVALALTAEGDDARRTATQGDEHVVERRRRAGEQLRLGLAERGEEEIDGGRDDADERGHKIVFHGPLQQLEVIDAHREAHADDGTHKRRYEHRTDDDGGGIDIQAEGGDEDGEHQDPEVRSVERHALAYLLGDGLLVLLVGHDIEILSQHDQDPQPEAPHRGNGYILLIDFHISGLGLMS